MKNKKVIDKNIIRIYKNDYLKINIFKDFWHVEIALILSIVNFVH